ncbi:4-hydroxy-tetrahydrodipicolinate reductase [Clostridium sp.]|uniref:4-hydroxy-tetrahydrodipicolinate reductase n=1 Tax=Clostridium sp. TaxID=1506 RepID=UPI0026227FF9|nr:4-hydroxy-tetrahydrodipicolinate reductase [Clostridium sp.]
MIKVIINGCSGKMGSVVTEVSKSFPNIDIVAGIDKYKNESLNYKIFSSPLEVDIDYDILLDFSRAEALQGILDLSLKNNKPIIICSTGFKEEDLDLIEKISQTIPIFRSANMSLGLNLINSILKNIVPTLYKDYDIEIIEKHHNQKIDSPSGTAILLADTIKDSISDDSEFIYGRSGKSKRRKEEIGIHAIRGGSIIGDHDIIFAGIGEIIEISHKAISREVFAFGAIKACEYMYSVTTCGLYNMDDVLKL